MDIYEIVVESVGLVAFVKSCLRVLVKKREREGERERESEESECPKKSRFFFYYTIKTMCIPKISV